MEWILASASPRRKELLKALVEDFEIIPSLAEEDGIFAAPEILVQELARRKAFEVALRPPHFGKVVIGADTVVALEGEVLGKPKDEKDAFRMLTALSGRTHEVYTGVCMARMGKNGLESLVQFDCTQVRFAPLSKGFIEGYIKGGSPMDKAGAYGIQDGGLVEEIVGSYTNVVGFPQELVKKMIEKIKREWIW